MLGYETDLWVGVVSEGFMEEQGVELAFEEQMNGYIDLLTHSINT